MTEEAQSEFDTRGDGAALVERVHDAVRQAILKCDLGPDSVVSQVQLAKQFGVSRTPLREVLRLLEHEGLVESRHNRRVRITGFSVDDFEQIYASRVLLESLAARHAMRSMSPAVIEELARTLDVMRAAAEDNDYEAWHQPHRRFHTLVTQQAGPRISQQIEQLADHADRYRRIYATRGQLTFQMGLPPHERILESSRQFDAEGVARAVARHLAGAAISALRTLSPDHDPALVRHALDMALSTRTT
ncbi:GntR family transcriptional regulator [Rhodococcus opacus]|nr:GntR family transcriptional regulator [Rhodococcus opacus]